MGIGVQVQEFKGEVVARLADPVDVEGLCAFTRDDPDRYPYLSGIDEYDDTCFNSRQSERLARELESIAHDADEGGLRHAAVAVLDLARLLQPAPGRPGHRVLVFVGD